MAEQVHRALQFLLQRRGSVEVAPMWEWALDWDAPLPNTPCDNCANLTASNGRTARGGSWTSDASLLGAANRDDSPPSNHELDFGFRCARTP
jgi:formylglycine-generating enzyme required for sulfatase activity